MADEIDAGQERGEVATHGGKRDAKVQASDLGPATFKALGLDRRRGAEWPMGKTEPWFVFGQIGTMVPFRPTCGTVHLAPARVARRIAAVTLA